jgi:hypothetical protein
MNTSISTAPLWSYGLAAISYLALMVHLLRKRDEGQHDPVKIALIIAVAATTVWAAWGIFGQLPPPRD